MSKSEEVEPTRWKRFLLFLYNPNEKAVLGRTGKSWGLILLFYLVYYIVLAGLFGGMFYALIYITSSTDTPYLHGKNSILKDGPGITIKPLYDDVKYKTVKSTLIFASRNEKDQSYKDYKKYVTQFLDEYKKREASQTNCDLANHIRGKDKVCRFPLQQLGACENPMEFLNSSGLPCVYIKMNQVYGWIPELTDNASTPLVQCYGQNTADKENMGTVNYFPNETLQDTTYGKFSHAFFPYDGHRNYSSPVVAMILPEMEKNVIIMMKCKLKGFKSSVDEVRFELLMDDVTG